jgi:hypothetical protein
MKLRPFPFAAFAILGLSLSSCETVDRMFDPQPHNHAEDPMAVVPPEFLHTRSVSLNQWLDEAVRVQIIDVPLLNVFDHPALRGLQYQIIKYPAQNPLINIDKLALTHRQLLWVIAHDYQLHMTPHYGPRGEVMYIEIRSRSVDLPKSVRE